MIITISNTVATTILNSVLRKRASISTQQDFHRDVRSSRTNIALPYSFEIFDRIFQFHTTALVVRMGLSKRYFILPCANKPVCISIHSFSVFNFITT